MDAALLSRRGAQRRVHLSPMIMNVAVPLPKHSPMFGHEASSHTECSLCSRNLLDLVEARIRRRRLDPNPFRFFSTSAGATLIGMREVLACAFCFALAS